MEIVQIDHTLVDLFVVDAVNRQPLQRPWLTMAIDIASRIEGIRSLHQGHGPNRDDVSLLVLKISEAPRRRRISTPWATHCSDNSERSVAAG